MSASQLLLSISVYPRSTSTLLELPSNEVASGAALAPSGKLQEAEDKNKEQSVLTYDPTLNLIVIKAGEKSNI
jgi:hypothetical protein